MEKEIAEDVAREALIEMVLFDRDVSDRLLYEESLRVLADRIGMQPQALAVEIEREAFQLAEETR